MSEIRVDTISEKTSANGVSIDGLTIKDGGITATTGAIVFNEASADVDFRVESNASSHLLFVDGGNDKVLIDSGNASTAPARTLHVRSGDANVASFEGHDGTGLTIFSGVANQIDIIGYDDGASSYNKLVIRSSSAGNNIEVNTDGSVTMPLQPAFSVQGQDQFNVGNGDTITFATEIFDQNADFASNTFTAPIAGRYQFNVGVSFVNPDDTANYQRALLVTSNRNYSIGIKTIPETSGGTNNYWSAENSVLVDMDASDTAYVTWSQSAGSNESDVFDSSRFSGFLVC